MRVGPVSESDLWQLTNGLSETNSSSPIVEGSASLVRPKKSMAKEVRQLRRNVLRDQPK